MVLTGFARDAAPQKSVPFFLSELSEGQPHITRKDDAPFDSRIDAVSCPDLIDDSAAMSSVHA
jgi:hypothetical protein